MQVSRHYLGQPHPALTQRAEANLCCFSGGLVGAHVLGQASVPASAPPSSPAGPPAPSSKTKRAPGGAKHDCNLGGRVGEAGYLCQCRSPKKTKTKQEWSIDALGTKFKLDFCLGPEVMGPNSPVSNPCQGCSDPTPTLANASLLAAESRSLVALAFSAPSSGWTGLLVTSPPPNQPALSGSTYYP